MKRGFLLKDASKGNGRTGRQLSKPKDNGVEEIKNSAPLSEPPIAKSIDQGKALPEDYDIDRVRFYPVPRKYVTMPHIPDGDGSTEWIISTDMVEDKVMKTPGYLSRLPRPRRPDLYEVRTTPTMGKGVFAKYNLRRGEIIFAERPLLIVLNGVAILDPKFRYASEQTNQIMLLGQEKFLKAGYERMSEANKALYNDLHNSHTDDGTGPLFGVVRTNGFGAQNLSEGISPFTYTCLCNIGSRLNHSCVPNMMGFFDVPSFSYQFLALRDIKAGEELYGRYCDVDKTKAERQTALAPYKFSCTCPACINATPASDNLRKTFRTQVSHLIGMEKQPGLTADTLSSAKALASQMLAEGLGDAVEYLSLLSTISVACHRLGKRNELLDWRRQVEEYLQIHARKWPSLLQGFA